MKYIGVDCYKKYDHVTMIDTGTREVKVKSLTYLKEDFAEFIGDRSDTQLLLHPANHYFYNSDLKSSITIWGRKINKEI